MTWTKAGKIGPPPLEVVPGIEPPCCHGGWKPVVVDGVERLTRCECWGERRQAQALAAAGVPARYAAARLGDYNPRTQAQSLALGAAKRFLKAFPASRGLWIAGEPGTGKTHLAAAVLRSAIAGKAATGLFTGAGELLHAIRHTYNGDGTEQSILDRVLATDVLVLDDVGADKPTEWAQTMIGSIVNGRYNATKPTIFTTTLRDVDATEPQSILFNLGVRTRSRLCEMCTWISL